MAWLPQTEMASKPGRRGSRPPLLVRAASWGAVLGVLGGCTVGPNFTRPEADLARVWSAKDDQRIATQTAVGGVWWKGFNDPVLDRLVDLAFKQSLPLQVSGLRIMEARARLGIATGQQYPQFQVATGSLTAVGLSENSTSVVTGNVSGVDRNFLSYQVGFDAAWEMDFWGKYRRGVEAEVANLLGAEFEYYNSLVTLTAEVARTYVVIRTFEVLIAQANENVRLQEEGLKIAESRFRNGATSELDPSQAASLLESTRATVPQLQLGLQQARNALGTLLGQTTGTVEALLSGPAQLPRAPAKVAISVPAEMLRRRPDIRRAELAAAAQSARIGVAKAELYPSFTLFGSVGLEASTAAAASPNLFSSGALYYSVGPRIHFPFFNYGRIKNQVRVEDARFEQLLVAYRETVLRAAQEVEDALTGYLRSQEALVFGEGSVRASQRAVEIALVQYREGAVDYQRVLDAQRTLLEQQAVLTQTGSNVITHLIALYKALGGGWELQQAQPLVPEKTRQQMEDRTDWGDMLSDPRESEPPKNGEAEKR